LYHVDSKRDRRLASPLADPVVSAAVIVDTTGHYWPASVIAVGHICGEDLLIAERQNTGSSFCLSSSV